MNTTVQDFIKAYDYYRARVLKGYQKLYNRPFDAPNIYTDYWGNYVAENQIHLQHYIGKLFAVGIDVNFPF
jgi:hypothetical protein